MADVVVLVLSLHGNQQMVLKGGEVCDLPEVR